MTSVRPIDISPGFREYGAEVAHSAKPLFLRISSVGLDGEHCTGRDQQREYAQLPDEDGLVPAAAEGTRAVIASRPCSCRPTWSELPGSVPSPASAHTAACQPTILNESPGSLTHVGGRSDTGGTSTSLSFCRNGYSAELHALSATIG